MSFWVLFVARSQSRQMINSDMTVLDIYKYQCTTVHLRK